MRVFLPVLGLALALGPGAAMAQTAAEREACQADFEKYCPGVQPGARRSTVRPHPCGPRLHLKAISPRSVTPERRL